MSAVNNDTKKSPMRRCLGCMSSYDKRTLIRVVRTPDGEVCLDETGKKSGRGAYICKKAECLKKAKKAKRLENNLKCQISDEVFTSLEETLKEALGR